MSDTKTAAKTALAGALGFAAIGLGAGLAQAEPPFPPPPPPPIPGPDFGPGANVGAPGNPLPPGQGYLPPGHRDDFVVVPVWAPPAPPPPWWAPWLPVVWNTELNGWGVWWNGGFKTAPF
jgi:hypothetical protein